MSIMSLLKARLARVASGFPGKFLLQSELHMVNGPSAALALVKRHVPLKAAHAVVTQLFDEGEAVVDVPMVESVDALTRELADCNVTVKVLKFETLASK